MSEELEYLIHLATPHEKQKAFIECGKKRIVICAGRRGGKTIGAATLGVEKFLDGKRVLYAAPTEDQISSFWYEVKRALYEPIEAKVFEKNETMHTIERPRTKQRVRAKTAFNADTLRGDYADLLILDEFQLMNEDTWEVVGAPMLADNDGDAVFIYTPPSLKTRNLSKAGGSRHASKMFKKAQEDKTGRWAAFQFTSFDNPYISQDALTDLTSDMTALAYRQEIMAEDVDEAPGALWTRNTIEQARIINYPELDYIVVGVDPSVTSGGDDAGIIVAGRAEQSYYIIGDHTIQGSPLTWAGKAIDAFTLNKANIIVAESNQGGEMVAQTIHSIDRDIPVKLVFASRGKATRAEPISALYERGVVHHAGHFYALEDEMCMWMPGDKSPNRMDALVWALTELSRGHGTKRVAHSIQG